MTPITILTGFLGSGKTTLINELIKQNPEIKFGLIVNEFGEIGIDGQLIEDSGEEMVEISNGCVCCVVRKDLQETVKKLLDSGRVNYILIETSGLAEPAPVAQTFSMDDLGGQINLDAIICLVDALNYTVTEENYRIALEQMAFADIVVLNKIQEQKESEVKLLIDLIKKTNPEAALILNDGHINTKLLIDTGTWSVDKLAGIEESQEEYEHTHQSSHTDHENQEIEHKHEHHHHEHDEVDEVVFVTQKTLDPSKLDKWLQTEFPTNVIRAKGFLKLQMQQGQGLFVFQMVGAGKSLKPFMPTRANFDYNTSRIVLIGKNLDKKKILENLEKTVI